MQEEVTQKNIIIIPSIVYLCRKKLLRRIQPQDIEDDIAIPLSGLLNEDNPLRDDDDDE